MSPSRTETDPRRAASMPLQGARLETVLIFARDFERLLEFYRDTLGLSEGFSNDHFAELTTGAGAGIALHDSGTTPPRTDGDVMLEFLVDDIEESVRRLTARGIVVDPIRHESFGAITSFRDPEGHRIGLEQPRK